VGVGLGYGLYGGYAAAPYYGEDDECVLRRVRVQTYYGLRWRTVRYCY